MTPAPQEIPHWVADWIGLPFREKGRTREGLDCWGLVRLVYLRRSGIVLPSYAGAYDSTRDGPTVEALIRQGARQDWREVSGAPVWPLDVARMRGHCKAPDGAIHLHDMHVGLYVAREWVLHIEAGKNSVCEPCGPGSRIDRRNLILSRHRWRGART